MSTETTKTSANATHRLRCAHVIGCNDRTYFMRCHVLKAMPDGRLKLLVFGERNWKGRDHVHRIRYVEADRVSPLPGTSSPQKSHSSAEKVGISVGISPANSRDYQVIPKP